MDDQIEQELLKRSASIIDQINAAVSAHATLLSTHGVTGSIVGTSDVQTLTNKRFGGAVNYSEFESNGFLFNAGDSGGYDDIQFNMTPKAVGAGHPTLATWNTDFEEWSYAVNDHANGAAPEVPHWWKQRADLHFHLHLTTGSANYVAGNKIAFRIYVSMADSLGEEPFTQFPVADVLELEYTFLGTVPPWSGLRLSFPTYVVPVSLTKIGGQIKLKLQRIAKSAGGTNPSTDPFVLQVGAHALSDTRTSRTISSK